MVIKAPSFDVLILGEKKFDIIKKETKSRGNSISAFHTLEEVRKAKPNKTRIDSILSSL